MVSASTIQSREDIAREVGRREERWVNVGESERLVSQVGGGVLLAVGLLRGGVKGLITAGLGGALLYRGMTGHCHLYEALGASTAEAEQGPMSSVRAQHGTRVEEAVTIAGKSPEEVYRYWRDYANLPRFMSHVESVTDLGNGRSHWVVKGPFGSVLEYDTQIHNETPGAMIAWRSIGDGDLDTAGSIHFEPAPGNRGTVVRVNQKFDPPGGKLGIAVARLLGADPHTQTRESLRRLKQILEAGEIATVQGQPSGRL